MKKASPKRSGNGRTHPWRFGEKLMRVHQKTVLSLSIRPKGYRLVGEGMEVYLVFSFLLIVVVANATKKFVIHKLFYNGFYS